MTRPLLGMFLLVATLTSARVHAARTHAVRPVVVTPRTDAALLAAIQHAVTTHTRAVSVEAVVGARAIVNTAREPMHRNAMRMVTILTEDGSGVSVRVSDARDVVYWPRPITAHNVPIVGIVWNTDGSVRVFTGYVLPP